MNMLADIGNEVARVRRQLSASALFVVGPIEASAVVLPDWLINQALRIEVNEYDWLEAWHGNSFNITNGNAEPPTEFMGLRIYAIGPRFKQLPAPGWRVVDPFNNPRSKKPMMDALHQVAKEKTP